MGTQQIVQLTSYQCLDGGTDTVGGTVREVLKGANVQIDQAYGDTPIGAGADDTDAVVITIPEVEVPMINSTVNASEFTKLTPSLAVSALMLTSMAAPREIPIPIAGGAIDVLSEMRSAADWVIRLEAIIVLSMTYDAQSILEIVKSLPGELNRDFFTRTTNKTLYRQHHQAAPDFCLS